MPKIHLSVFIILCVVHIAKVQAQLYPNPVKNNLSITAGATTQKTNFRWSIAGNIDGTGPNIYSEIIFNPVHAAGYHAEAAYNIFNNFSVKVGYQHLYTHKGKATDFDYTEDNRTAPNRQLYLNSNKGKQSAISGQLTYHIFNKYAILLQAGTAYTFIKELFYLLDDKDPSLQTTYEAIWNGLGLQLHATWKSPWRIKINAGIGHQFLKYSSKGNWNLIQEFQHPVSFTQTANGNGWQYHAGVSYPITRKVGINLNWLYHNLKTRYGMDRLYLKNGNTPETRMNGAFNKNGSWQLSITCHF